MDCVTCGCEIIGYNIERTASTCSNNHLICNKCTKNCVHICQVCEEKTLYCDILRCDYQSIMLLIDMQRQFPQKRKSMHGYADRESELLEAEEEIIEEYISEEEEDTENEDAEREENELNVITNTGDVCTMEETNDAVDQRQHIKCVDNELLSREEEEENDVLESTRYEESISDYFDFMTQESRVAESEDNVSMSPTTSWAQMSSEEDMKTEAICSKYLHHNPLPASKLQLKTKNKSLCAQVFAYNLTVYNSQPQHNIKYVQLGTQNNCKPSTYFVSNEEEFESTNEEVEDEDSDSDDEDDSHCLKRGNSMLFSAKDCLHKNVPMIDFTTRFYHTTNKRLNRWQSVNKNPNSVMHLDDEQLFVWRVVKQGGKDFQSLFVVTASKGDKRMKNLLQKLQTADDNYIYANYSSESESESENETEKTVKKTHVCRKK